MQIESYLRYIRSEKNYSSHTVISYKNDLKQFEDFIVEANGCFSLQDVENTQVRDWVVKLMETEYSPVSVKRKISALRSFFKYKIRQGDITVNPTTRLSFPKTPKKLPVFLREQEMDRLIDDVDYGEGFTACRDRLIITILYSTGIRRSELIGLKDKDVDFYNSTVKVTGKGDKQRLIPFGQELKEMLEQYLTVRNNTFEDARESLILNNDGLMITNDQVYKLVKKYLSQVSSLKKRSPHVLRHTFASAMLNNGADLNAVKELLGHSSLSSTEVYTHITFEELKKNYNQAHPRAK